MGPQQQDREGKHSPDSWAEMVGFWYNQSMRSGPVRAGGGTTRAGGPPQRPTGGGRTHGAASAQLVTGLVLLGLAALLGIGLSSRPDWFDIWGLLVIRVAPHSDTYRLLAYLGSPPVLLIGIIGAIIAALRRDRRRALACLLGPGLAILVAEQIAKPLVDRQLVVGHPSFPSGTVVAVSAVATVVVLALPQNARILAVGGAALTELLVGVAVVGLGWHYPTDVVGGVLVGTGCVLVVDALTHLRRRPRRRTPRAVADLGPVRR